VRVIISITIMGQYCEPGSTVPYVLQSFTRQHKCRCVAYFRFPMPPPSHSIIHPQCNILLHLHATSYCSYAREERTLTYWGTSAVISFWKFHFFFGNVVDNISTVINEYEERFRRMQVVPLFSHERLVLRSDGAPNRAFL
jgi:hypothetical protein